MIFTKQKKNGIKILLDIMVLVGLITLVSEFSMENDDLKGILFGILSAFFFAFITFIVKKDVKKYDGSMLMFYQVVVVSVLLLPSLFFNDFSNLPNQYPYVIMVALITTCLGHTLVVKSLKYFFKNQCL